MFAFAIRVTGILQYKRLLLQRNTLRDKQMRSHLLQQ